MSPNAGIVSAPRSMPSSRCVVATVQKPAGCDALGNVQFLCGFAGPEDLVVVPGGQWVIASGDAAPGAITLIEVKEKTTSALYPSASLRQRFDAKTYDSCPGPIDPEDQMNQPK